MSEIYKGPIEEVKLVEKVTLTEAQHKAIQLGLDRRKGRQGALLQGHATSEGFWANEMAPLNKLTMDKLARALYVGYEIEPEQPKFQAEDIIIDLSVEGCPLIKIHTVGAKELFGAWGKGNQTCVHKGNARLATPEEIFWLETLGREKVGDFREGDIYVNSFGRASAIDKHGISLDSAKKAYIHSAFQGIYPAESFKPYPGESK